MVDSAELISGGGTNLHERFWYRPAISLVGLEGMPLAEAANNLLAEAAARVSGRLAPGQDPAAMSERALNFLGADPT